MAVVAVVAALVLQAQVLAGVLVDRRLAEALPAAVGDTVWVQALAGTDQVRPFVIEGVYERAADPSRIARNEYEIRFHLPDLEAMLPTPDRVDRFAVSLRAGADAEGVSRWIESLAFGTQVFETERVADQASTTFRVISRFHDAIGVVTLLASGIFLLCLMVIRVDNRRRDVRTMRLVGISRSTVVRMVLIEASLVAVIGSAVGSILGILLAAAVNAYYAGFYDTTLSFAIVTPRIVLLAVTLGVALGVGAGILAAARVAGMSPQQLGER